MMIRWCSQPVFTQDFADRCPSEDPRIIGLLTRLFCAIASPDAFYQLRDGSRQNGGLFTQLSVFLRLSKLSTS